jgi:hypothetical protein
LDRLDEIECANTQIGDAGLMHLAGLKRLEYLDVRGTRTTRSGIDRLKQSRATLKVLR